MAREEARARVIEDADNTDNNLTINADGSAFVKGKSTVSTNNSSSTPLGISGVFTGTGEDITDIGMITVSIYSDVASATDGLSIQFSTDNTNWDHTDEFTVPATTGKTYTVQRVAQYFRIVYTNGTTAQTSFRLQVLFSPFAHKGSTHRISDSITTEDDAELITSILKAEDTVSGNFGNLQTTDGKLLVSADVLGEDQTLVHEYTRTSPGSHPTVLISYTVPTGKKVVVTSWHFQTASAIALATLEAPAGTEVDAIRFSNSADTNRQNVNYGAFGVVEASAGQVIQIETQSGDTGKEFIAGFTGIQSDA